MAQLYGPPNPYKNYGQNFGPAKPAAKKKPMPKAAAPIPAPSVAIGEVQPNFAAAPEISMDPMLAQDLAMPLALQGMPLPGRGPGAQDLRTDKYGKTLSRGKTQNTYQAPEDYYAHLQTVMGSPTMKDLATGLESMKGLREEFLKNMPVQTDLSPVMAFADFLSKGQGKALAGYKRPSSYEDSVAQLAGLLQSEQRAKQANAQLAFEQAGGLKSGTEEASTKTDVDAGRVQGQKTPQPRSAFVSPQGQSSMAARFMTTFDNSPVAKDAAQALMSANAVRGHLSNPNWLGDSAARAGIIQAMRLSPVSNRDVEQLTGSQDLFNKFDQMLKRVAKGDVFTAKDRQTIERYADYLQRKASANLSNAADEYARSHGPMYGYDVPTAKALLAPAIPKIQEPPPRPPSAFQQLMQQELQKGK